MASPLNILVVEDEPAIQELIAANLARAGGLDEGLAQSQHVRVRGAPEILIITEEETLVFEGHVDRALTEIDQDLGG